MRRADVMKLGVGSGRVLKGLLAGARPSAGTRPGILGRRGSGGTSGGASCSGGGGDSFPCPPPPSQPPPLPCVSPDPDDDTDAGECSGGPPHSPPSLPVHAAVEPCLDHCTVRTAAGTLIPFPSPQKQRRRRRWPSGRRRWPWGRRRRPWGRRRQQQVPPPPPPRSSFWRWSHAPPLPTHSPSPVTQSAAAARQGGDIGEADLLLEVSAAHVRPHVHRGTWTSGCRGSKATWL